MIGIIALPVLAVLLLLGYITVIEVSDYRAVTAAGESVSLALAVQDLTEELQTERGLSAGLLGGNTGFRDELGPVRKRVDERRQALARMAAEAGDLADRFDGPLRQLDGLAVLRSGTDSGGVGRAATYLFFTERIASLNRIDFGLGDVADRELRRRAATLDALSRVKEGTAQQRAFLNGVFSAGGFADSEFAQFAAMRAARDTALNDFAAQATPGERAAGDWVLDTGAAREAAYFEQVAVDSADGRRLQVNPQSWWSALTTVLDGMRQLQRHVGAGIEARAEELRTEATRRLVLLVSLVLAFLAGAVALLVVAGRSITRPLAVLAMEANDLATTRLPVAVHRLQDGDDQESPEAPPPVHVPARSSVEVRSVARALDQVQEVAFRLATEQAMLRRSTTESLANLGRRNQNLLRRQLGFITELEREETDPTGLANLFELDHLATRMRRNAESLLVLVGAAGPRQWLAPLGIADVIRAAVSEVEEYRRVQLRRIDDAWVVGASVTAVAHVLAELIENGLTFSPPDADVEIQGRRTGQGYLIAITDQGIGMSAEDLAEANRRLRGEVDFVSAPTRYLGHQVVGQLARELKLEVQLTPSPVTGVTARVLLPSAVLSTPNAIRPDDSGHPDGGPPNALTAGPRRDATEAGVVGSFGPRREIAGGPVQEVARTGGSPRTGGFVIEGGPVTPTDVSVPAPPVGAYPMGPSTARPATGQPSSTEPAVERTSNGLRKRLPRARRTSPAVSPAAAVPETDHRPATIDAAPADIRDRLTALRAGVRRGRDEGSETVAGPDAGTTTESGERT
ncbi:nitrate- and nitrite sensing domain-containing protein [Micromonospora zhanjiangensis]|uniref:histidine kinase n=1 Tax=Micromonospora zhanjiangensis TaxID=1522057 RepID=A0ABV8KP81_9ACTN